MLPQSIDIFSHTNPAFAAVCLRWLSEGFQKQQIELSVTDNKKMMPIYWGIIGLALLSPDKIREQLPKASSKRLQTLFSEHEDWKNSLALSIKSWADPFWKGVRFGTACSVLRFQGARIQPIGEIKMPVDILGLDLRKKGITLGKIFAKEPDTAFIRIMGEEVLK